jgi:hypothetical protein
MERRIVPNGEHKASKQRIAAAEKQRQALELRKAGESYDAIAEKLGYSGRPGAYKAVKTALEKTIQEPADELRRIELERLDTMLKSIWHFVEAGNTKHVAAALRIMERRASLLGLDAPKQVDVKVTIREEVARMVAAGMLDASEADAAIAEAEAILRGAT